MQKQIRVKSARTFVLVSTLGHAIQFRKGEETTIPAVLMSEALTQGVIPVEDDDLPQDSTPLDGAPIDPLVRNKAIKAAIVTLKNRNNRDDFGATGNPKVAAIEKYLGWKASGKEIEALIQELNNEAAEGNEG
jgi:hypothetical protein